MGRLNEIDKNLRQAAPVSDQTRARRSAVARAPANLAAVMRCMVMTHTKPYTPALCESEHHPSTPPVETVSKPQYGGLSYENRRKGFERI
jgi:hypothetical protein